jgi:sugar-specific transcriptional regulator TrmB
MQYLTDMGLTQLEAEVYVYLLQHSPATGYRVARDTGRTNANVYKALESLQAKGAVLVDDGENRLCRAVPAAELLDQMQERFCRNRERAEEELRHLPGVPDDDRVYRLSTTEQVYERCRGMMAAAERCAVLDLFPEPLERVRSDIAALAARGVEVWVHAYMARQADSIPGAQVVLHRNADAVRARWNTEWVSMVVDGAQYLAAMLAPGGSSVHQAVWSASPILSWIYFSYAEADLRLSLLTKLVGGAASLEELRAARGQWAQSIAPEQMPAYHTLAARLGRIRATDQAGGAQED